MSQEFQTLYKQTNTGKIQYWSISVQESSDHSTGYELVTRFGQLDGKEQVTVDLITSGKNIGKANETSVEQQAINEAKAKWERQLKKGYVISIESAKNKETDALIQGGIDPMLAFTFEKQGHKIKYPCFGSPKMDGLRMIAIVSNGKATLWSRTRKPITSMNHIVLELEKAFPNQDIILDGEAFNNIYKNDFESIVSAVRKENAEEGSETIQYHVFDIVNEDPFSKRYEVLKEIFSNNFQHLVLVENEIVNNEDEVADLFRKYKNEGQEGLMLRNSDGPYVGKRSADLIKVKEMQDAEFKIVGIEEGRGRLQGHVGSFICVTDDGQEFNVKMSGKTDKLREFFENHDLWKGKMLTVQFQDYTQYSVPRFPVGIRIRTDF